MKRYACLVVTLITVIAGSESARTEQPYSSDQLWTHRGRVVQTGVSAAGALQARSPAGRVRSYGRFTAYWKGDAVGEPFFCAAHPDQVVPDALRLEAAAIQPLALNPSGGTLRTYRLAVSVTGEYTRFFDGNPPTAGTPNTVNQITTTVNRVTAIYEREVQIRLAIVATRIFTDPATDPFPSATNDLRDANQTTLDANPGADNYDVGHVFSQGGSGDICRDRLGVRRR